MLFVYFLVCELYGLVGGIFGLMLINILFVISVDCYYVIVYLFRVVCNMICKKVFIMICIVWVWFLCFFLLFFFGWGCYVVEGF